MSDNSYLIVDYKVSLTNYEEYFNADNEEQKKIHLKKHIESIRKHIRELSEKKYESLYEINAPDYVLMFVPIEPAYLLALNNNNLFFILSVSGLAFQFGFQSLIHMASNTDLIPTKGMTLPFLSYGGSSILASAITAGILLSLTRKNTSLETISRHGNIKEDKE